MTPACGKKAKVGKFGTISAGAAVQKSPTLHFRLFQRTFLWHLFENIAAVFTLIPELFQFTHIQSDHGALTSSGVWSKPIYIHGVWSSPEQARIPSLTQTAAPLQSSVVHFVVAVKSFPSAVALFSPFGVFPQRKQTNNRPFSTSLLLMLNEQRRIPEELEYFIRVIFWKLLSSVFLPLSWWNFRMLQQLSVCVRACERKQLTQRAKTIQSCS